MAVLHSLWECDSAAITARQSGAQRELFPDAESMEADSTQPATDELSQLSVRLDCAPCAPAASPVRTIPEEEGAVDAAELNRISELLDAEALRTHDIPLTPTGNQGHVISGRICAFISAVLSGTLSACDLSFQELLEVVQNQTAQDAGAAAPAPTSAEVDPSGYVRSKWKKLRVSGSCLDDVVLKRKITESRHLVPRYCFGQCEHQRVCVDGRSPVTLPPPTPRSCV